MTPSLRDPVTADYVALAGWVPDARACLRWAGPLVPFPLSAETLPVVLDVATGCSRVLSLGSSGPALAFGQHWVRDPGAVHLGRIIVAPSARGAGIGRTLCLRLIGSALQATGASSVTLRVYRDNAVAVRLYESLGFLGESRDSTDDVIAMRALAHGFMSEKE